MQRGFDLHLRLGETPQRIEHGTIIQPGRDIRGTQAHGLLEFVSRLAELLLPREHVRQVSMRLAIIRQNANGLPELGLPLPRARQSAPARCPMPL